MIRDLIQAKEGVVWQTEVISGCLSKREEKQERETFQPVSSCSAT